MNIITGTLFLGLFFVFSDMAFLSTVVLMLAVIGYIFALVNGIPMRLGGVDNDGYNAFSILRSREAARAFWVQLKANEQVTKGVRLKDMPEAWFAVPSDEEMKNSIVAVMGVFACGRLMDMKKLEEADVLMSRMLASDSGITGLHRGMMICDRMYCELIGKNRSEALEAMLTKEQKKFMKQMKNFPSVIRTEYTYALLCEKDEAKAEKIKERFEKRAESYPYENDMQAERELIELAERKNAESAA